ncbi:glutamate--tRNA ligase [Mangrovibacterium diazotrophicum]|uniref:Glutamate--tRNA ligase n=1 Tax=Mangrovibacterium diazotrophicum TaxID=1261403 RepID=A0A419WAM4_9BACT|nr:glutamate--tRNA ligase [Mangrovibacterium diazotrophicum]RKD92474.1 glutamyl-tRNA synthetase [Mangrovibacterium diazotrophicum]
MEAKVRVRFAPSPTGPLHMGGVRTALFNYLFAKKLGGDFLLRIEDTDQTRYVPGAEDYIIESLKWCGLVPDEGVGFGGEYGPYRQSERKAMYRQYADQLVEGGNAYYAFDTPEDLDALRKEAEENKTVFSYDLHTRNKLQNSLTLSAEEVEKKIAAGDPWVIRFKMPENTDVIEKDLIRGEVKFNTNQLDDKVLFKADGMPTYHLANVVDDHLMKITHVIRGEEWLPSMPLHVLLYKALGWEERPQFAHLPLILKPTGKGKLSKRDGDKMGFPVFPLLWTDPTSGEISRGYREDGYFPEAFINLLALLGWNAGTEQEFFSMEELIENFSLDRVVKSGARFDPEKAKWFNRHYLQEKSNEELTKLFKPVLAAKGVSIADEMVTRIIAIIKERCEFVTDLWEQGNYFFQAPESYDDKTVKKKWKEETPAMLNEIVELFKGLNDWNATAVKEEFSNFMNAKGWGFGVIMVPIRLALVGSSQGADLFDIFEIIGKEETISRIEKAVATIK